MLRRYTVTSGFRVSFGETFRNAAAGKADLPARSEPRRHRKLYQLTMREEREEGIRDFLPPQPLLPLGWKLQHESGSNRFDLFKNVEIRQCGSEELHIITLMETKQYEGTYRMDNGEREEQEYLNFGLFMRKKRYPTGGLEFSLTSIDLELVMDGLTIHPSEEAFENAKLCYGRNYTATAKKDACIPSGDARRRRASKYAGPMLSELDDDLSDEILDYLDERGVNNAFAEFVMDQAFYFEQEEYINWLRLLRKFSD
ncbi:putative Mitochondrial glycoprotein [Leishmania naiffi]|uniref:Mitochondrial glycoprotein n=1 Tax=Leishmania naiffi TaxID=5678 RepID=A0AAW3BVG6_9TRYP